MTKDETERLADERLRARAEGVLAGPGAPAAMVGTIEQIRHELEVDQIELQMQNESLRQAQIQLAWSRDRYVDLYDFAPVGYVTMSADGMIESINLTGAKMLGVTRKDLLQRRFAGLVVESQRPLWMQHVLKVRSADGVQPVELSLRSGPSSVIDLLLNCERMAGESGPQAMRIAMSDISERKKLELKLEEYRNHLEGEVYARTLQLAHTRDQAEAGSRAKSTFLSVMNHELRTPLQTIMGMIELVSHRATDAHQLEWLGKGMQASKHLLSLIDDALDISRIEADQLVLKDYNFSPRAVIDEVLRRQGEAARAKGLHMLSNLSAALPDTVRGDRLRFEQILQNFTSNSIKFSERGEIMLRADVLSEDSLSVTLRVEVSDEGIGLTAEQQCQLFAPFTQVDGSSTRRYGGAGLGLVIARRIAQLMGGEVGVSGGKGAGCVFWATMRLLRAAPAQADAAPAIPSPLLLAREFSGARVLVAEDETAHQQLLACILQSAGLQVDLAVDGEAAVEKARQGAYDLVLMDINLPKLNGVEATRMLQALPGMAGLTVIALTASVRDEDRQLCLEAGMSDFIRKPVGEEELCAMVLRWLRSKGRVTVA